MKKTLLSFVVGIAMITSSAQASIILDPMESLRTNVTTAQSLSNTWQLGIIDNVSSSFSLLSTVQTRSRDGDTQYRWFDGNTSWFGAYFYGSDTTAASPNWLNPSTGSALPADALGMHTFNDNNQDLVLRYLASEAGTFDYDILFQSNNSGTKTALVKDNSFNNSSSQNISNSSSANLTGSILMQANQSVYIGYNSFNGWGSDAASIQFNELSFTQAQVSAPGTLAFLFAGFSLLGFRRFRKA